MGGLHGGELLLGLLRKAAARTFDALLDAVALAIAQCPPSECANYIAHDGYRLSNRETL